MAAFRLETLFVAFDRIALRWSFAENILFPVRFTLWRSESAAGGFEPVLQNADKLAHVDAISNQSKYKSLYYYCSYVAPDGSEVRSNTVSLLNAPNNDVLRLQKRERFKLAKFDGVPAFLFTRRRSGPPCPRCTSTVAPLGDMGIECKLCFGTGMEGGYYRPSPIYVAKQMLTAKGSNLMDNRVKESSNSNMWTSNWTIITPEDVIVEMVPPNTFWRVTGVQLSERYRSAVRQLLTVNEVDHGNVVNFLPIPTDFAFPDRKEVFFQNWEDEDFDAMFARLSDEFSAKNTGAFAAPTTNEQPAPELPRAPGQKDPITGYYQ